ncbi:unnamed protein product [Debaryomyces tyrocola]|nr:unnamed protein product [Debaryomyces tyrocola]
MSTQLHFSSQPLHESPDHNSSYSHQNGIGDRLFLGQRRMILLRVSLIISPLALFGCPNGNIGSALSILLPFAVLSIFLYLNLCAHLNYHPVILCLDTFSGENKTTQGTY